MRFITTFLTGLIFGIGIVISGMANPAKVLNFFDFAGTWDPSLGFVMGGALIVTAIGYQLVFRRGKPIFEGRFTLPNSRVIDRKLVLGSATFGLGWGIAGFCPGGALPAIGTGRADVLMFVGALLIGMMASKAILARQVRLAAQSAKSATSHAKVT